MSRDNASIVIDHYNNRSLQHTTCGTFLQNGGKALSRIYLSIGESLYIPNRSSFSNKSIKISESVGQGRNSIFIKIINVQIRSKIKITIKIG